MSESIPKRRPGSMRKDTRAILRVTVPILGLGILCSLIVVFSGGLTKRGPTTTLGWLCLMVALGSVPTGVFFSLLGLGKYLEDRKR